MKNITMIKQWDDAELYALDGTNKAVKITWGFATGSDVGTHNSLNTFAIAELGTIDEDGEFEYAVWSENDFGKGIYSKQMIGHSKVERGWNPSDADAEEVDWDEYGQWAEEVCKELLA